MTVPGCGPQSVSERLLGTWVGAPDPAAGKIDRPVAAVQLEDEKPVDAGQSTPTDLEAFQFRITIQFAKNGAATMWLDDSSRIEGSWQVLSVDRDIVQLELTDGPPQLRREKGDSTEPIDSPAQREQRRFELEFDTEQEAFTLKEEGADKRFGRLLFKRTDSL